MLRRGRSNSTSHVGSGMTSDGGHPPNRSWAPGSKRRGGWGPVAFGRAPSPRQPIFTAPRSACRPDLQTRSNTARDFSTRVQSTGLQVSQTLWATMSHRWTTMGHRWTMSRWAMRSTRQPKRWPPLAGPPPGVHGTPKGGPSNDREALPQIVSDWLQLATAWPNDLYEAVAGHEQLELSTTTPA